MTPEQLLVLAAVVLVPLINLIIRAIARRHGMARKRETPVVPAPAGRSPVPRRVWTREHPPTSPLPTMAPPVVSQAHSRLGSLREVRRGIILMTILGPCRALEPPGSPGSWPRAGG